MANIIKNEKGESVLRNGKEIWESHFVGVVKAVDPDKRTMTMRGTDETKDRDGDIIRLKGWELENYVKNPVFLWSHDYRSVPIARSERVIRRRDPSCLEFHLRFPEKGIYPFADMILALYAEKFINASSVGFIPRDWQWIEIEDEKGNKVRDGGREFLKQELLELSGCAVPSNPSALQDALSGFKSISADSRQEFVNILMGKSPIPMKEEMIDVLYEELKLDKLPVIEEDGKKVFQVGGNFVRVEEELEKEDIGDSIEKEDVSKPYPGEHACRLNEPGKYDSFARKNCGQKHDGKCIDIIYGIKDNKSEIQALRYKKDVWDASAAKDHCGSRGGSFEAAKEAEPEIVKEFKDFTLEEKLECLYGDHEEIINLLEDVIRAIQDVQLEVRTFGVDQAKANDPNPKEVETSKTTPAQEILSEAFKQKKESPDGNGGLTPEQEEKLKGLVKELKTKLNKK